MDPRHPEQAVIRLRDLLLQYNRIESDMLSATTTAQLGQLEREGGLVVQEICLVAPRIHESLMQTSRQRRHDLSRGILIEPQDTAVETPQGGMFEPEVVEEPVEKSFHRADVITEVEDPYKVEEPKPKKKTTRNKKTTKKAKK